MRVGIGLWKTNPVTKVRHLIEQGGSVTACGMKVGAKWRTVKARKCAKCRAREREVTRGRKKAGQ